MLHGSPRTPWASQSSRWVYLPEKVVASLIHEELARYRTLYFILEWKPGTYTHTRRNWNQQFPFSPSIKKIREIRLFYLVNQNQWQQSHAMGKWGQEAESEYRHPWAETLLPASQCFQKPHFPTGLSPIEILGTCFFVCATVTYIYIYFFIKHMGIHCLSTGKYIPMLFLEEVKPLFNFMFSLLIKTWV